MGSFYSLHIARSGLFASQRNIDITGHNIANADTEGFSRQRLQQSSVPGINFGKFSVGAGVSMDGLTQIRDKYLDAQYRNENSASNELDAKFLALEYIEGVFAEPTDFGLNNALSKVFNALDNLGSNAHELSLREIVVQNAVTLCDTFRTISRNMLDYQTEVDNNITLYVDEVNMYAEQIAQLNETIFAYESKGNQANDLRDQRNLLIDKLSAIIPVQTHESEQGKFSVKVNGIFLVDDVTVNKMEVRPGANINPFTGNNVREIFWEGSTTNVNLTSGKIKGLLDIRDGATKENQGIPYYMTELDSLAQEIITGFNTVNNAGFTIPYDGNPSVNGVDFFDSDPANFSALNIRVSDELLESGYNIAASSELITGQINWGNKDNIVEFSNMRNSSNIEEHLQSIISDVAINTNYYGNRSKSQRVLTSHIETQKLSVSEVSLDEEMTNLIQFRHSYDAAAKLITVIDEMLVTLINIK